MERKKIIAREQCKHDIKELFLSEKAKKADIGPQKSDVNHLLEEYSGVFYKDEKEHVRDSLHFLSMYLTHCRHCARPVDWVLVERLLYNGFLD